MKRKVVKQGPATFMISLPSKWVKKYGVQKGDEVEVEEKGSAINISLGKGHELGRAEVNIVPGTSGFIKSIISNAYKKGYDEVKINFQDANSISKINEAIDSLLGFEIIEEGSDYCIAKNVAKGIDSQYDPILKKSFNMILDNGKMILDSLKNSDYTMSDKVESAQNTVTKFTDFCKRLININMRNSEAISFNYTLVWTLEKIGNEFRYLYRYCRNNNVKKISPEIIEFYKKTLMQFELFRDAYYTRNLKTISDLIKKKDSMMYQEAPKLFEKLNKDDANVLNHLCFVIRRIHDMTGPFFGIYT